MAIFQDRDYLRNQQYGTSSNLNARAELHRRFSTNVYGFPRWAFEQMAPQPGQRVLEAGGGPGWLWRENLARLPAGLRVVFSDLSLGMVREAHAALASDPRFTFANADVQAIPMPEGACDLAVANHMLYHVPDVAQAARELRRVLAPGGRLYAATNGERHMQELYALAHEFEPLWTVDSVALIGGFTLENAQERLRPGFERVEVRRYEDALWVTEAQPLVDYIRSMSMAYGLIGPERAGDLRAFFQQKIDAAGGLRITKDAGLAIGYTA